jgi:hypothetical protein
MAPQSDACTSSRTEGVVAERTGSILPAMTLWRQIRMALGQRVSEYGGMWREKLTMAFALECTTQIWPITVRYFSSFYQSFIGLNVTPEKERGASLSMYFTLFWRGIVAPLRQTSAKIWAGGEKLSAQSCLQPSISLRVCSFTKCGHPALPLKVKQIRRDL